MASEHEINERVELLAQNMLQKRLAFSISQARERARDVVMQEVSMQQAFEKMKDDPTLNPQQRKSHISAETMKQAGGMLTGNELPQDIPLAELLKGKKKQ
jgi:hypothetical protein